MNNGENTMIDPAVLQDLLFCLVAVILAYWIFRYAFDDS